MVQQSHTYAREPKGARVPKTLIRHTYRPPKGDRSEGFYTKIPIFIDFSQFGQFIIEDN